MLRVVLFGFVVSVLVGEGNMAPNILNERGKLPVIAENLDPIMVGHTISSEYKKHWELVSAKYYECGLCGEVQAFPAD